MIIEESDFKLIPVSESSSLFDLELLYTVNKGKSNERTEFRNAGYGFTLPSAIRKVIMNRIENKHESISLKTFLKEFKDEVDKLDKLWKI